MMIKFIITFCFLFLQQVWATTDIDYGAADCLPEKIRAPGLVKVRVWADELHLLKGGISVGHASVETANSYVSFWPSRCDGTVFSVPGALVQSYEADYELEENKAPSHVFLMRGAAERVDAMMLHYSRYEVARTTKQVYLNDSVQWYSLGSPTASTSGSSLGRRIFRLEDVSIDSSAQYFNCASLAAAALCLVDEGFFEDISSALGEDKRKALQDAIGQYQENARQSFFGRVATGIYPFIILPSDLVSVFRLRASRDITAIFRTLNVESFSAEQRDRILVRHLSPSSNDQTAFWKRISSRPLRQAPIEGEEAALFLFPKDGIIEEAYGKLDAKTVRAKKTCSIL